MTHDQVRELAAGYVLGALEPSEAEAVNDHLARCAQTHPEFETLGSVVPALLEIDDLVLVAPPASLGQRIMTAAAADLAERAAATATPASAAPTTAARPLADGPSARLTFPGAAEREARRERARTSPFDWALRIAAVIAIVAVGAWGLNVQGQLDAARRYDNAVATVIQAASQPGARPVILSATEGSQATGIGAIAPDGSVVLAMRNLPATSGSQVYETWVIDGEEAPVAVGGFTVDQNGTATFTSRPATTPPGATIALTLEPSQGSTAPKGPIVSVGVALAAPGASS